MKGRIAALLAVGAILAAAPAISRYRRTAPELQPPRPELRESRPGLLAGAAVRPDSARRLALDAHPGARIVAETLRERGRRLTYVFRMQRDGLSHEMEVLVDAESGRVVPVPPRRTDASR
jgi:hypothetical protein